MIKTYAPLMTTNNEEDIVKRATNYFMYIFVISLYMIFILNKMFFCYEVKMNINFFENSMSMDLVFVAEWTTTQQHINTSTTKNVKYSAVKNKIWLIWNVLL